MDEKHLKTKKKLKILGFIALTIAGACIITAFVEFFIKLGSGSMPKLFWMFFIGFPLAAAGGVMLLSGYRREMSTYIKNESAPVFNDATRDMSQGFSNIARAVKNTDAVECGCGVKNDADAKFCKACAAPLDKICDACGARNDLDSKFCKKCAKELE